MPAFLFSYRAESSRAQRLRRAEISRLPNTSPASSAIRVLSAAIAAVSPAPMSCDCTSEITPRREMLPGTRMIDARQADQRAGPVEPARIGITRRGCRQRGQEHAGNRPQPFAGKARNQIARRSPNPSPAGNHDGRPGTAPRTHRQPAPTRTRPPIPAASAAPAPAVRCRPHRPSRTRSRCRWSG